MRADASRDQNGSIQEDSSVSRKESPKRTVKNGRINIKADTNKGARHLKRTLKDVAKASSNNGNVTINMNYKTTSGGGYSNNDIENIINNFI